MPEADALTQLATAHGIEPQWHDIWGHPHEVPKATLRSLLAAIGVPAADDAQVQRALEERESAIWREPLPPALVVRQAALPMQLSLRLPESWDGGTLGWRLVEENGVEHGAPFLGRALPEAGRVEVAGERFVARRLSLDTKPALGYHRLLLLRGQQTLATAVVIVAPATCYQPDALQEHGRAWGPAVQLYALRSERNWGIGDFTDLRLALEQWAQRGAGAVGLNPLHALFPHNPEHASPYSPSSRLFLNPLYLDPEHMDEFGECEQARRMVASAEFQARLRELRAAELVDYAAVAAAKLAVLELLYAGFRERHLAGNSKRAQDFRAFQARSGIALQQHALFEALQEHLLRQNPAVWGWPVWPKPYRDPRAAEVRRFADANPERMEFFQWLQWQADRQLAEVAQRSFELHLGVGVYGDLAVSVDRGGAEAWSNQDLYALGASLGAPPDDFNPSGQNWGLPPVVPGRLARAGYAPFVETLRANMRHNGALRIDHVMGFMRLFWIPSGAEPAAGAYVRYPLQELLGILALESHRNRCMVVGEDLGTVPDEVREAMLQLQVLSCRVLYFERHEGGEFKPPNEYPPQALVAASTHDLPTLAGFWEGRDLALRTELKLFPSEEARQKQTLARSQDRVRLLLALEREGLLPAGITPDPASAPSMTPELTRGIQVYLARTPCKLCLLQMEDVLGLSDQVNLPGTSSRHPNWRRKLTLDLERWPQDERFVELCEAVNRERPARVSARARQEMAPRRTARIPLATYRLQLNRDFNFAAATALVPYLAGLGISHVYCSPYLRARAGSAHGYDIIDHSALNPEIGSREDFERFVAALHAHDMGQIMDLVPNHMGVMGADNLWWMDVLENGRASVYAEFFDIDWEPGNPALHGKVLVPVLGEPYGLVLERADLRLDFERDTGSFGVFYHQHRFAIDPREYPRILERAVRALPAYDPDASVRAEFQSLITALSHLPARDQGDPKLTSERNRDKELHKQRLAALCHAHPALATAVDAALRVFNGTAGEPHSFDALHELLDAQAYRLAFWRVASDEINYRRFFDINELAALRIENEAVFEATHRFAFELVAAGQVDGVRIDHPDGLYDPAQYFRRLQDRFAVHGGGETALAFGGDELPVYLVIEKITAGHERIPESWPVHGTTGYRFANLANGLFVDTSARGRMARIYRVFAGQTLDFDEVAYYSKRLILRTALAAELTVLSNQLARVAQADRHTRDFTLNNLRQALTEVIACFPVYRTYGGEEVSAQDRRFIEWAVGRAKRRSRAADIGIFDFVRAALLGVAQEPGSDLARSVQAFARKFQQLTAPVTAKGVEDTAFYRYNRLVSLNDVGGNPSQFGFTLSAFHGASLDRSRRWPHTMLASSTHDSKRSADVRLRINVLSEIPAVWRLSLRRWTRINRSKKRKVEDALAPSSNDEYLLYQTLLGTWPLEPLDEAGLAAYRTRMQAYMLKAVREAKVHSSWINVNAEYETAVNEFVQALLGRLDGNLFLDEFLPLQRRIAWLGMLGSLSHTAIKLASPGVPDIFQGDELWNLSLVDPDNRRPVDYDRRRTLLGEVSAICDRPGENLTPWLRSILLSPEDGRCKFYVTCRGLRLRRARPELFGHGEYVPLTAEGSFARHLVAFARRHHHAIVIVIAPRLLAALVDGPGRLPLGTQVWGDTAVPIPWIAPQTPLRNVLTGQAVAGQLGEVGLRLGASELLAEFPVAMVEAQIGSGATATDDGHGAPMQ